LNMSTSGVVAEAAASSTTWPLIPGKKIRCKDLPPPMNYAKQ